MNIQQPENGLYRITFDLSDDAEFQLYDIDFITNNLPLERVVANYVHKISTYMIVVSVELVNSRSHPDKLKNKEKFYTLRHMTHRISYKNITN
jgi:hypothetical protein